MEQAFLPPELHSQASTIALVVSNLLPIIGVLFFGWSLFLMLLLYWVENVIIGIFNVVRMITVVCANPREEGCGALIGIPFFIVHYGAFCAGHGYFLVGMYCIGALQGSGAVELNEVWPRMLSDGTLIGLAVAVAGIAISHWVSYVTNFVRNGEYRNPTEDLMGRPYGRILILHFTIFLGGFLIAWTKQPIALLVLLVLIKTWVDLILHWRERKLLAAKGKPSPVVMRIHK